MLLWLLAQFFACALVIAHAGTALCRSADDLADAYGWGRGWVGLALLATVTSLPELASGISAVARVGAPDLALGGALGACVVNLLLLVVVDALLRGRPLYRDASPAHLVAAGFGMAMLGMVLFGLLAGARAPAVLHLGLYSPLLLLLYLLALRSVHARERRDQAAADLPPPAAAGRTRRSWRRFGLAALLVVAAGSWLPGVAADLARTLGLSDSFAGTVLMAVVTTLPELAVTLGALRLGALDMAVGNLLGSNLFNILIVAVDDAAHLPGPLLTAVAPVHGGTVLTAMAMTALVVLGLALRPRTGWPGGLSWVSLGLAAVAAANAARVYLGGS